jgi:hypothetical protein
MLKKTLRLLLAFLFSNAFAVYQTKLTDFPKNMSQCFSCNKTQYAAPNYPMWKSVGLIL